MPSAPAKSSAADRALRADAQRNRERLLDAAARVFASEGTEASMKEIAKEAGVGIGTLYRHFPTREMLVEATYRSESARLSAAAADLLRELPPAEALRAWMERFLDYMAVKRGMAEALRFVLSAAGDLRLQTRGLLIDALATLLKAGEQAGEIRAGLDPVDVVMALGGFALIASEEHQPALSGRLLDLLFEGLAASQPRGTGQG